MIEDSSIEIEGLGENPTDNEVYLLVGNVVHVAVGGSVSSKGSQWFDLFRFARVLLVTPRSQGQMDNCSICGTKSVRFKIEIEWEAGYECDNASPLCEYCIDGVVREGQEFIVFANEKP